MSPRNGVSSENTMTRVSENSSATSVAGSESNITSGTSEGANYGTAIASSTPVCGRPNFFNTCNMEDACQLNPNEGAGIGKTGTFRAKAMARRYVNTSRKELLKQSQGNSYHSLISQLTGSVRSSERTPLVSVSLREPTIDESKVSSSSLPFGSIRSTGNEKNEENIWTNFLCIWIGKPICLLLIFIPFAFASHYLHWSATWIFCLNFLTMVPLASILGDFTEEAALHTNDVVGGLLNASFGNAVEVVVAIQALMKNEIRVVQASMIGSIFSNLLLVLGCCFLFGGYCYKEQSFSSLNAMSGMGLLALSSIALILPTPFAAYYDIEDSSVLIISRVSACFMLFSYLQLLFFQLYTHKDSFEAIKDDEEVDNDEEKEEEATVPMWMALLGLGCTTAAITIFSDYLVASIDDFCLESGISRTFVGLIILPIVGNAVEHMTAVSVAMKNKMDLALGVAIGSCTQIALFVVPVTVLFGWFAGKPMTLNFPIYEIALYILSIFTVSICLGTGKSNWLLGSILVITYIMIGIGFWFEKVEDF